MHQEYAKKSFSCPLYYNFLDSCQILLDILENIICIYGNTTDYSRLKIQKDKELSVFFPYFQRYILKLTYLTKLLQVTYRIKKNRFIENNNKRTEGGMKEMKGRTDEVVKVKECQFLAGNPQTMLQNMYRNIDFWNDFSQFDSC